MGCQFWIGIKKLSSQAFDMENIDNGTQNFRHIHIVKSTDGGATWSSSADVTPHDGFGGIFECVFGSMNPQVDDKIRIVYQKDDEPGTTLGQDEDLVNYNDIVYLEIDTAGLFDNTSTSIIEAEDMNKTKDNRIFDVLGREWKTSFANLPKGIYIIDGKKIFKNR